MICNEDKVHGFHNESFQKNHLKSRIWLLLISKSMIILKSNQNKLVML